MQRFELSDVEISQIMTKEVITTHPEDTVEAAVKKMVEHEIECLPVVSNGQILVGLITFRDVVTKFLYQASCKKEMTVAQIMSENIATCGPDCTVLDVAKIMKNKNRRRIPIVNSDSKLIGIVTNSDLALLGWNLKNKIN